MHDQETYSFDRLIARLKAGDEAAMAELQRHLERRMLRAAYQHTGFAQVAEDAVAITFAKIWRKRDLLPSTWAEATKYMLTMTSMTTIDIIRSKEERVPHYELQEAWGIAAETQDESEDPEVTRALDQVESLLLPHLGRRHLKVLAPIAESMRTDPGTMQEIYQHVAQDQGLTAGSVRNSWSDAGQHLQQVLQELGWTDYSEEDVRVLLGRVGLRLGTHSAAS